MTDQRKKEIADHYMEATNREELRTREAARYLNLNPCYLSMVKTERHWSSMSQAAWDRLEEWHESRCKISEFVIPEGEEIFKKPERKPSLPEEGTVPENYSTGSAAAAKVIKKKGRKKLVKKEPQSSFAEDRSTEPDIIDRVKALEKKVTELNLKNTLLLKEIESLKESADARIEGLLVLEKDNNNQIEDIKSSINTNKVKSNGKDRHPRVVFFQRNYYKS